MEKYIHSVRLDKEKCRGCTNCIKRCPTEAIRVRNGKAVIIEERCIDCGECIRVCPYHAKKAYTDQYDKNLNKKRKVVLVAPSFYGQFKNVWDVDVILNALLNIGFDEIYEVALTAQMVTEITKDIIKDTEKPAISSACPAVERLITIKFPELIENVIPVNSPMEMAGKIAKEIYSKKYSVEKSEVETYFISPCAAKMTAIKRPFGIKKSNVDKVVSFNDISLEIIGAIDKMKEYKKISKAGMEGIIWANSGGEKFSLKNEKSIYVDGINNVSEILEEIENGNIKDIEFVEMLACTGGCVGGPLIIENNFVAKSKIERIANEKNQVSEYSYRDTINYNEFLYEYKLENHDVLHLDENLILAMEKMEKMNNIKEDLPGLDCGACGAPSCLALAEDVVRGYAETSLCVIKTRELEKQKETKRG